MPLPFRIGFGWDLHRFEAGRPLRLGGVEVPHPMGLAGHSDADVACHALGNALLGAAGQGDLGAHFPDSDPKWKGVDGGRLLAEVRAILARAGWVPSQFSVFLIAQAPRLAPHRDAMRRAMTAALGMDAGCGNVAFATPEGTGALGRQEAIAAHAVAVLEPVA